MNTLGFRNIFGAQAEAILLIACLTLWSTTRQFTNQLNISNQDKQIFGSKHWKLLERQYNSIKKLADLINSIHGFNATCFMLVGVLEYAIGFQQVFVEQVYSFWSSVHSISFYAQRCITLLVAAEVCHQVCFRILRIACHRFFKFNFLK